MKKTLTKILSVMLIVCITLTSAPLSGLVGIKLPEWLDFSITSKASTVTGTCGDNLIWTYDTTTKTLTISGTGTMYDYEYNTQPWKSYRNSIREVNVKSGVKAIGDWAFCYCDSLTNITISNSVISIGKRAFQYCESLICITLPNGITTIDKGLFYKCTNLTNVTIPDGVTSIGELAFSGCESITSITIPNSVTSIEDEAFEDCISLTSITVDSNNQYYSSDENGVLFNKDKTTLIQYPAGNTRTTYTIPDSITIIGLSAFRSCVRLTSVTIPDSVIEIGNVAFWCCTSLISITIPESVTTIGDFTFTGCDSLISITLPDSVTSIGGYAFHSCNRLTDVYYVGTEVQWNAISIDSYNEPLIDATFHCNTEIGKCGDNLKWIFDESTGVLIISGVGDMDDYEDVVPPYDPYNNTITTVVFTDGVTSIGEEAFYGCDTLENVYFSESVKSIGHSAFSYCENIKEIVFPEGLEYIGIEAFNGCTGITGTVVIPKNVSNINAYTFQNCNQIESVVMYATGISPYAFHKCSNLKDLTIDKNLSAIDVCAFQYCSSIESVYYSGTQEQWNSIRDYSGNSCLFNAKIYYNSISKMASIVAECEVGDIIEFGSYPQRKVTDETLLAELNSLELEWFSYGYYSGTGNLTDGKMTSGDYMKYADVIYNGNKYRAVRFTEYRPCYTGNTTASADTYQDDNEYYINTVYWFKYEPLMWRVLDPDEGFVLCETIIDSQPYNNTIYLNNSDSKYYQDSKCTNFANDYATSSIRFWLNYDFYNFAFNDIEKNEIVQSKQNNNCSSSRYPQYNSDITNDKIFLISYNEATANEYGFSVDTDYDDFRVAYGSDYAKSQGLNTYYSHCNSWWWLRSPGGNSRGATAVGTQGKSDYIYETYSTKAGVRPALKFNPKNDNEECKHNYVQDVTVPTCIEQGFTTYTCSACGDTYTSDYVDVLGHTDGDIVEENYVAPTCTANGSKDNVTYCTVCSEETSRETIMISALGHDIITDEAVAPDCTNTGLTAGEHCSRCDYKVEQTVVDALGHDIIIDEAIAPDCTNTGLTAGEHCTRCDYKIEQTVVDALGHHIIIDEAVAPDCTNTGLTTGEHCSRCDYKVEQTVVDALSHDIITDEAVAPDCTNTGLTAGEHCSRCDYKVEQTVVDALGHDIITDEALAPDCISTGLTTGEHCSRCDYKVEQTIVDALGHKYESVVTAPTCTAQGFTTYTCHCGDTYTSDYVVASGHNYKDGICTDCDTPDPSYFTFEIQKPSTTTIRCKDGIKLHAKTTGKLPDGARIEWSKNNNNFDVNASASGNEITIISKNNGYTTFTATVYDADNNVIAQDTIEMYSKAGLFDKIGGFFRSLFGATKIYEN